MIALKSLPQLPQNVRVEVNGRGSFAKWGYCSDGSELLHKIAEGLNGSNSEQSLRAVRGIWDFEKMSGKRPNAASNVARVPRAFR